jgi:hypothetical protein
MYNSLNLIISINPVGEDYSIYFRHSDGLGYLLVRRLSDGASTAPDESLCRGANGDEF